MKISRGDIYLVSRPPKADPRRRRAVVVVSRQTLCESNAANVVCAPINTQGYGRSTEVEVGESEGLKHDSVINCDQLVLIPKSALTNYLGSIPLKSRAPLDAALRIALDV